MKAMWEPDSADEYGCCALDAPHDGPCAYVCNTCNGSTYCWLCRGTSGQDDVSWCEGCDGTGDCNECYEGLVSA